MDWFLYDNGLRNERVKTNEAVINFIVDICVNLNKVKTGTKCDISFECEKKLLKPAFFLINVAVERAINN